MEPYTSKNRKIVDFCAGFFGFPGLYWLFVSLFPAMISYLGESVAYLIVALAPLVILLVYGGKRRFVFIGVLSFFGAAIFLAFGSCLLSLAG